MKKNNIKNNLIYYRSVIDRVATGFMCHIVHFCKTGKLPQKRTTYTREEIGEELKKIEEEKKREDEKEAQVESPGPKG